MRSARARRRRRARIAGQPGHLVGLGGDVAGALPLRQVGDEEPGAVAPRLEHRRQPRGPDPEQVGAQHQPAPGQELGERQLARLEGGPVGLPVVAAWCRRPRSSAESPASSTPDSSNVSRTAAHTSARAVASSVPSRAAHSSGLGPAQAIRVVEVARVHAPAGEHAHAAGEGHRGLPPQQVDLEALRTGPQQHDRGRVARLGRLRVPSANARASSTRCSGSGTRTTRHATPRRSARPRPARRAGAPARRPPSGRAGRRRRRPRRAARRRRWRPAAGR